VVYAIQKLLGNSLNQNERAGTAWMSGLEVGNGLKEWHSSLGIEQFRIDGRASRAARLNYNLAAVALLVVSDSLAGKQRFYVQG
jgi:hypothetical protein